MASDGTPRRVNYDTRPAFDTLFHDTYAVVDTVGVRVIAVTDDEQTAHAIAAGVIASVATASDDPAKRAVVQRTRSVEIVEYEPAF